jgi:hypothetical protein|tara:strand:- start:2550 stop:2975 length:426 start_codon:yes stop_codon:yes gene_type:complete
MPASSNTGIKAIVAELKGIRYCLESIWHTRYTDGETDVMNPQAYADEYITLEECSRRLNIAEQTLRNWITMGRKGTKTGWKEGIHYVNINADTAHRGTIRIPWSQLVATFAKNEITDSSFYASAAKYQTLKRLDDLADPDL